MSHVVCVIGRSDAYSDEELTVSCAEDMPEEEKLIWPVYASMMLFAVLNKDLLLLCACPPLSRSQFVAGNFVEANKSGPGGRMS